VSDASLEVNAEKTKYTSMSPHQNAGQSHDIKIGNRRFENVEQFILGNDSNKLNLIHEERRTRLNSDNAGYYLFQKPLSSRLLSKLQFCL
jgi:hypothetical protein